MNESCIQIKELAAVVALPEGDPGREHLDSCSRCQALAEMLRELERPDEPGDETLFQTALASPRATAAGATGVSGTVAPTPDNARPRELASAPGGPREPASASGSPRGSARALRSRLWFEFTGRQLVGAAAALLVVNALVMVPLRAQVAASRKPAPPASEASAFGFESMQVFPDGVEFSWGTVPNAILYRVVLLDESKGAISRLEATPATHFRLDASALPEKLRHGSKVSWAVEALTGNELLAVSPAHPLRLP